MEIIENLTQYIFHARSENAIREAKEGKKPASAPGPGAATGQIKNRSDKDDVAAKATKALLEKENWERMQTNTMDMSGLRNTMGQMCGTSSGTTSGYKQYESGYGGTYGVQGGVDGLDQYGALLPTNTNAGRMGLSAGYNSGLGGEGGSASQGAVSGGYGGSDAFDESNLTAGDFGGRAKNGEGSGSSGGSQTSTGQGSAAEGLGSSAGRTTVEGGSDGTTEREAGEGDGVSDSAEDGGKKKSGKRRSIGSFLDPIQWPKLPSLTNKSPKGNDK